MTYSPLPSAATVGQRRWRPPLARRCLLANWRRPRKIATVRDVTTRLIVEGVIDKPATSKTALRVVQAAFNTWMEQSGKSLTEISRVLAMSL